MVDGELNDFVGIVDEDVEIYREFFCVCELDECWLWWCLNRGMFCVFSLLVGGVLGWGIR